MGSAKGSGRKGRERQGTDEANGVEACTLCALCSGSNAAYILLPDERRSTRHAVWLLKNGKTSYVLYAAMLNGTAQRACPVSIDVDAAVIEGRQKLVKSGVETAANKAFMAKLAKGNPYK